MVSPDVIKLIKRHIHKILNIPNPKNLNQLRSFLGNFNYYSNFIENHAAIIASLSESIKGYTDHPNNLSITLTQDALEAIKTLQKKLTQSLVQGFSDFNSGEPSIVNTDASFVGLAYVISQIQEGRERIVGYGSIKLLEAETKYHINKLALLSVIKCLKKFFSVQKSLS